MIEERPFNLYFKEGFEKELKEEFKLLKPTAQRVAIHMAQYCVENGFRLIITDVMSDLTEDLKLGRVSASHREGRAFDFRIHGWSKEFKDKFETFFESYYATVAAVSKETGKPNLILYHNVKGLHGHCQIRPYV